MKRSLVILGLLVATALLPACKMSYSFTGASIPAEAKTISVEYFANQAPLVVATLSQTFTDGLRDKFASQTTLDVINRNGDLAIEGIITGYSTQAVAIQGNEQAALNRLTITVKVKFTNKFKEKDNFEQAFTRYADYSSSQNLVSVQEGLIQEISEGLIDDIFNKAVVNW